VGDLFFINALGDLVAWVFGKLIGRTFDLDREKAHKIGKITLISIIAGVGFVLSVLYS
jgi:hypothetical protein